MNSTDKQISDVWTDVFTDNEVKKMLDNCGDRLTGYCVSSVLTSLGINNF